MKIKIRGINKVRSKGRLYYYHRKTGTRIDEPFGTAAFLEAVEKLNKRVFENEAKTKKGSLGQLINEYKVSPEFTELADRTRSDYQKVFDYLQPLHNFPLVRFDSKFALKLRDKAFKQKKRRFANYVIQVLKLVFVWGVPRKLTQPSQVTDVPKIRRPHDARVVNRPWKKQELEAVLIAAPSHLKVAICLGAMFGLRQGDVIKLPHSAWGRRSNHNETRQDWKRTLAPGNQASKRDLGHCTEDQSHNGRWPKEDTLHQCGVPCCVLSVDQRA